MIENIPVFILISILVFYSIEKRAVGWLVFSYYAVYIIIELDYFGVTFGDAVVGFDSLIKWYLIYTAISFLFFIASLIIYITKENKVALFYACWILLNMFISGLSSILQSLETNIMLPVYNALQDLNILVDIMVVILGTDANIKGLKYVRSVADRVSGTVTSYFCGITQACNRGS